MKYVSILFIAIVCLGSCKKDEEPEMEETAETFETTPYNFNGSYLPPPALPEDNPLTQEGVMLGRMLFYEKRLSDNNTLACAGCHRQTDAFSDLSQFSIGTAGLPGERQAMAIVNMAWNTNGFFWDGRSESLRDQSLRPIQDPLEMNQTLEASIDKIKNDQIYKDQFKAAFNSEEVTSYKMSLALEQFMLSMVSVNSKYDRVLLGLDQFTEAELHGKELFETEYNPGSSTIGADCVHCHSGFNFQNNEYMNNGLDEESDFTDLGLFNVTQNPEDRAKFKVPTLRNIALTPPYMHDGRFNTLEEVLVHYNEGIKTSSTVDPAILTTQSTGLGLTQEDIDDIVLYLHTFTDDEFLINLEFSDPFQ